MISEFEKLGIKINKEEYMCLLPKNVEMLIDDDLWVVSLEENGIVTFAFLGFDKQYLDNEEIYCEIFLYGWGVPVLKSCSHSHWGNKGYICRPNFKHIRTALDWLEKKGIK